MQNATKGRFSEIILLLFRVMFRKMRACADKKLIRICTISIVLDVSVLVM